jgi:hypothetical protein
MTKHHKQFERLHFISKSKRVQKREQYEVVWNHGGKRERAVCSTMTAVRELGRARKAAGDVDVKFRRVGKKGWQSIPKRAPKPKSTASSPGQDALDGRLPGSFESGKRR